jgi:hypothetical protein
VDGHWRPSELACDVIGEETTTYAEDAKGHADPLAAALAALRNQGGTPETVRPVGYVGEPPTTFGQYREGRLLATVELLSDGNGGWLAGATQLCQD